MVGSRGDFVFPVVIPSTVNTIRSKFRSGSLRWLEKFCHFSIQEVAEMDPYNLNGMVNSSGNSMVGEIKKQFPQLNSRAGL
jgi:hypothetical protein